MAKPLVGVVIPTFNSGTFLGRCLMSVRKQTYPNIAVVVVDRNSTDATRDIAEHYGIRVALSEEGRSEARNAGANLTHGDCILSLDSDMELASDVVSKCVAKVAEGFDAVIIPETSIGEGFWAKCKALEKSCYVGDETIEAARFLKKGVFEKLMGYDPQLEFGEDWDLDQRISEAGYKIGRIDSYIRHNEGRLSLQRAIMRKHHYGRTLERYRNKHPEEARRQLRLIRPAFMRNWRRLKDDPNHALGMLLMKTCELAAGWIGTLE
jgi:glycosyltransferase involved in cell wall biosynthesis